MAWGRFGDTSHSHRKVLRAMARDPLRGAAVWGVVTLCLSWSTQESQDWWVSESFVRSKWGDDGMKLMREAQACGLVKPGRERRGGENGWLIDDSDPELLHIRTKEEVERDREKSRVTRQKEPTRAVRLRDGDQCRYCGKTVDWTDRVSLRSGTYDHPDPADRAVFVVSCKGCNTAKYNRTVQQWAALPDGRQLLPPPDEPLIGDKTAEQFGVQASTHRAHPDPTSDDAATARAGNQPSTAATPPAESAATRAPGLGGELDLDLAGPRGADLPASGRDGPGQDGSGSPGSTTPVGPSRSRSRDGPPRGSRGKRKPKSRR